MNSTSGNRALALAGLLQATHLVNEAAYGRAVDEAARDALLTGIFNTDPQGVGEIYGGAGGVIPGLRLLRKRLLHPARADGLEPTRYAVNLLYLERHLTRSPELQCALRRGIERIADTGARAPFAPTGIADLAQLYRSTIGTLSPRVLVKGDPQILAQPDTAALVRALLLAGIRSAVLWRQCGGRRLRLLFERRALLAAVDAHLSGTLLKGVF
ncbi:MAG TPA: DUF489 family protein [Gammaproteobacteria bacterium]|nr:DUF489 family protein [Gammaproteobacteria bacterium]